MTYKKYIFIYIIIFTLFTNHSWAAHFDFSPTARLAYNHILALRLSEGQQQINNMRQRENDNYLQYVIENYIDCLKIFINEDKNEFDRLLPNRQRRLDILAKGDVNSPYYLFAQAHVRLWWAMNHAKFGEYVTAFNEVGEAFSKLEANQKKYPNFMPNKMVLGAIHSLVGSIPEKYKWGVKVISGLNGTVAQGQAELEEVIKYAKNNDFTFEQEAIVMYAFLTLHLNNQPENAWQIVNSTKVKPQESLLMTFALSNIAMRIGKNDRAIELLQNRPSGTNYFACWYLDFMLGVCKLQRNDADSDVYFYKYVKNFKGRNYIKEAYQRIAWFYLLRGDTQGYWTNINLVKTFGKTEVGGDKNALKEAKNGIMPDPILLRSRLLFDGGYFQKSLEILNTKQYNDYKNDYEQLEYQYRMGRILQSLKKNNEATTYYNQALQLGRSKKYYYACAAALQIALIYEQSGNHNKAREFFNYCLALQPDDYADPLHTKAKAGLSRLRK